MFSQDDTDYVPFFEEPAQRFAVYESAHYILVSDLHPDFCSQILSRLEYAYAAMQGITASQGFETGNRLRVRIFSNIGQFQAFQRERWKESGNRTSFVYHHTGNPSDRELDGFWKPVKSFWASLQHELFHAYFRTVFDYPPQWLDEGFAELMESTIFKENGVAVHMPHLAWIKQIQEQVLPAKAHCRFIPLRELMLMSKDAWLAEEGSTYPLSWAAVYFLYEVHGGGRQLLKRYISQLNSKSQRETNTNLAWKGTFQKDGNPQAPNFDAIERDFKAWLSKLGFGDAWNSYRNALDAKSGKEKTELLLKSVRLEPDFYASRYFLSLLYFEQARYKDALEQAEAAVSLFPEYVSGIRAALKAASALNRFDVAEYYLGRLRMYGSGNFGLVAEEVALIKRWRQANPGAEPYDPNPVPQGRIRSD